MKPNGPSAKPLCDDELIRSMDDVLADAERIASDPLVREAVEARKKHGTLPPYSVETSQKEYVEAKVLASRMTSPDRHLSKVIAHAPTDMGLGTAPTQRETPSEVSGGPAPSSQDAPTEPELRPPPVRDEVQSPDEDIHEEPVAKLPEAVGTTTLRKAAPRPLIEADPAQSKRPAAAPVERRWLVPAVVALLVAALVVYLVWPRGSTSSADPAPSSSEPLLRATASPLQNDHPGPNTHAAEEPVPTMVASPSASEAPASSAPSSTHVPRPVVTATATSRTASPPVVPTSPPTQVPTATSSGPSVTHKWGS